MSVSFTRQAQILIRGGDNANIAGNGAGTAHTFKMLVLQKPAAA